MDLTERQEQFNAAMERFTSNRIYTSFGRFIALANIFLQIYLLYRVWDYSIGVVAQVFAFMAAYVLTDFINGLVHMFADNNDRYGSIAGPLIANFHMHHKIPRYKKNNLAFVYFNETGSKVWLVGYLLAVLLLVEMGLPPVASSVALYFSPSVPSGSDEVVISSEPPPPPAAAIVSESLLLAVSPFASVTVSVIM